VENKVQEHGNGDQQAHIIVLIILGRILGSAIKYLCVKFGTLLDQTHVYKFCTSKRLYVKIISMVTTIPDFRFLKS